MKRNFTCFMVITLISISSLFYGCSSNATTDTSTQNEDTAINSEENSDNSAETTNIDETEMTIWNRDVANTGVQTTPIADEIAKKTGVRMNIQTGDAQKFKVLLAGGDLPEIIFTNRNDNGTDWATIIESGQMMPMDDLVEQNAPSIKENFADLIDFSKEYLSTDGQLYYLPIQIYHRDPEKPNIQTGGADYSIFTRYDLYKKLNPEPSETPDEYLQMLKDMQDMEPINEAGQKTYALSSFNSVGVESYIRPFQSAMGEWPWSYGMSYNMLTEEASPTYYSEIFWESMRLWNKAYNMGIVDPETFIQTEENYVNKLKSGQTFVTYFYDTVGDAFVNDGHPEKGFEIVPTGFPYLRKIVSPEEPFGWGEDYSLGITINNKDPEKAIGFLDFCYSEEGARLLNSGIEGEDWVNVDGKLSMTEEYMNGVANDPNYSQNRGFGYYKLSGYSSNFYLKDGYPARIGNSDDEKIKAQRPIDLEYIADSGYDANFVGEVLYQKLLNGEYETVYGDDLTSYFVTAPSDDAKVIASQVDEYMKVAGAELVMAPESDFEAMKEEVIKELDVKGYNVLVEEMTAIWSNAKNNAEEWANR